MYWKRSGYRGRTEKASLASRIHTLHNTIIWLVLESEDTRGFTCVLCLAS